MNASLGFLFQNVHYAKLIRHALQSGDYQRATSLFEQMGRDGIPRNNVVWTTMIQGCFDMGQYGNALLLFEKMGKDGVRDR